MSDADPGWPSLGDVLVTFAFTFNPSRAVDRAGSPLVALRALSLRFVLALVLFGVVLAFLTGSSRSSVDGAVAAVVIVVVGGATLVLPRTIERDLDCSSDESLATSYRTRFFLRMASAQAASLVGFVGFFMVGNELWAYVLGRFHAARLLAGGTHRRAPRPRPSGAGRHGLRTVVAVGAGRV